MKVMKHPQIDYARSADPDCSSFCYSYFFIVYLILLKLKEILSTTMIHFSPTVHPWKIIYMCLWRPTAFGVLPIA